jgi:hypothetical protein
MSTLDKLVERLETGGASGNGAADFEAKLRRHLRIGDRQISILHKHTLGGRYFESVYVNFVNLPHGYGGQGGGAEAENNRASFWIHGFHGADEHASPPRGKVKIEMSNSTLYVGSSASRENRFIFRAKTGTPDQIAKYLADRLNDAVKSVPPRYTHSKPPT